MPLRALVVGGTGYTGGEVLRLLARHPSVTIAGATSRQQAGRPIWEQHPHLRGSLPDDLCFETFSLDDAKSVVEASKADAVFLCLPHGASAATADALLRASDSLKVIDLSADFRLRDVDVYERWYGKHPVPERIAEATYGMPEHYRIALRDRRLVAVPGCYPTSVILALAPALRAGLIEPDSIIADAKSGVSGAGRDAKAHLHFPEVHGSFSAYGVARHRHVPEMEQELSAAAGEPLQICFTPHLIPASRGILSTCYARLRPGIEAAQLREAYAQAYQGERFVDLLPEGHFPSTAMAIGSNLCRIGLTVEARTQRLIVIAAIDNLVKGAAGAALQCFNLLFGLEEDAGLQAPALAP